ncbi:MAG TPA: PIN domain-containing protein [Candidatus Brocadiia bacterium]|nr:PIN domain-containing protein [Candidatus Brocadiales bacterium]
MKRRHVKVFLDSNVILSGLLSDKGAPRVLLDILSLGLPFLSGATGEYNMMEIERNLNTKLPKALPVFKTYFPTIRLKLLPLPNRKSVDTIAQWINAKDAPVLASALSWHADYLITGNIKDFDTQMLRKAGLSIKIVSPASFVDETLPKLIHLSGES